MASVACTSGTIPLVSTIPSASLMIPLFALAQNAIDHAFVRAWNYVRRNQFTDLAARGRTSVHRCPHASHVPANHRCDESAADLDNLHEFHCRRLAHRVAAVDQSYQTFGLYASDRLI